MKRLFLFLSISVLLWQCADKKVNNESLSLVTEFKEYTVEQNQAWVDRNLDSVMQARTFAARNGLEMPYRIFIPSFYSEDKEIPLLIHLHGRGERGTDNRAEIYNKIPLFNSANSIISPNGQNKYPSIVLVPQCSNKTINEEWAKWIGNTPETPFKGLGKDGSYQMTENPSESGVAVFELIDSIISQYNIDKKRVYITGLSMGGFGTWEYVGRRPELFAAAVPMAGYSDPTTIEVIKDIPFWIFHGGADTVNPPKGSQTMYKLLTEAGASVKYTEYPGLKHSPAFQEAWKEKDLLSWIFAQKKD